MTETELAAALADEILDVDGAAKLLSLHPSAVRRMARNRQVPCRKVGRVWRFSRTRLVSWVANGGAPLGPEKPEPRSAPQSAPARGDVGPLLTLPSQDVIARTLASRRVRKKR